MSIKHHSHVVLTANTAWSLYNFRRGLIYVLLENGYRVTALAPSDEHASKLEALGCRFVHLEMDQKGRSPLEEAGLLLRIFRFMRRERPDAVLSFTIKNNLYSGLVSRVLGYRLVPNVTGLGTLFAEPGTLKQFVLWLYKLAFSASPVVFFQNDEDRNVFTGQGVLRAEKTRVLPGSGVDLEHFSVTPLPGSEEGPVFLMACRLLKQKGVFEFAQAAQNFKGSHPSVRFKLMGFLDDEDADFVDPEQIDTWVRNGIIEYCKPASDIRPHLKEADVVVLPTYYNEGTPRILLEAAACGRPIITTDIPGCRDVVKVGVNGMFCLARSSDDLAKQIRFFINCSTEKRAAMGLASREIAEAVFDEHFVINSYMENLKLGI